MSIKQGWWKFWTWRRSTSISKSVPVFREFIYLDEISVISLLVSHEGEITEQIQEGTSFEEGAQLDSTVRAGLGGVKAEAMSSFQTRSSQSVQTTRKANIQSQFRNLLRRAEKENFVFPGARPRHGVTELADLLDNPELCRSEDALTRGSLIELEVVLRADPIYRIGSLITEVASMSEEHPEVFSGGTNRLVPSEMRSYAKLLERFMAGLVPVRASVRNVRLFDHEGVRYVVDAAVAEQLGLVTSEIELVGVSEKDSYWKDIRRVLFSDSAVTVLARVNVDGIKSSWSPVKLVDLFESSIPGVGDQLSALARMDISQPTSQPNDRAEAFKRALVLFAEAAATASGHTLTGEQQSAIDGVAEAVKVLVGSTESQRLAFGEVIRKLNEYGISVNPHLAARLRRESRSQAGLSLFPSSSNTTPAPPPRLTDDDEARLLEVEVVAMYW